MANTLGVYNPTFYAVEGLRALEKALGMARRVHRGFDQERRTFGRGDTVSIRRPSTFTVANAPATAEDLTTGTTNVTLDQWKEVKFKLSDKELAYTGERIVNDHIRPAAYALADNIDQALAALWYGAGSRGKITTNWAVADITAARKRLFDLDVPMQAGQLHLMVDGAGEQDLLNLTAFTQQQGAGDQGVSAQMTGSLGTKFGFGVFANQNVGTAEAAGSLTSSTPALQGAHTVNATSIIVDDGTMTGTVSKGDVITIGSDPYGVAADATAAGNAITLTLAEGLRKDYADNTACSFDQGSVAKAANLAWHTNAFAFASARLPEHGNELGARIASVQDPLTGLALRSRMYYVGNSSEVHVAMDVLYGVKLLDGRMVTRIEGA